MADYTTGGIQQQDASIYIGKTFMEKYEVKEILGQGAMGVVLKVWDTLEDVFKAIKVVPPQLAHDELSFKGLKQEVNASSKVTHPNVLDINSLEKWQGIYFIVMEYIEGKTLAKLLAESKNGKLPEKQVLGYMKQICEGLVEAHKMGTIHLDLKPQNIMVDKNGRIKVLDFSISHQISKSMTTLTGQNQSAGTLPYMAPEQLSKKFGRVNEQTDIWGLGATLYHLLSGAIPYESREQILDLTEEPYELEGVSEKTKILISKCMDRDRKKRISSINKILIQAGFNHESSNNLRINKNKEISKNLNKLEYKKLLKEYTEKINMLLIKDKYSSIIEQINFAIAKGIKETDLPITIIKATFIKDNFNKVNLLKNGENHNELIKLLNTFKGYNIQSNLIKNEINKCEIKRLENLMHKAINNKNYSETLNIMGNLKKITKNPKQYIKRIDILKKSIPFLSGTVISHIKVNDDTFFCDEKLDELEKLMENMEDIYISDLEKIKKSIIKEKNEIIDIKIKEGSILFWFLFWPILSILSTILIFMFMPQLDPPETAGKFLKWIENSDVIKGLVGLILFLIMFVTAEKKGWLVGILVGFGGIIIFGISAWALFGILFVLIGIIGTPYGYLAISFAILFTISYYLKINYYYSLIKKKKPVVINFMVTLLVLNSILIFFLFYIKNWSVPIFNQKEDNKVVKIHIDKNNKPKILRENNVNIDF